MKKFRTRHLALILSAAAIAAAGCGSSSKSSPATPATPTTAATTGTSTTAGPTTALAAQMNTLCKQANAQAKGVTDLPKLATIAEQYLPKFEALKPSAAQKADYDQYVAINKAEIAAAKANDTAKLKTLAAKDQELAAKLGATDCARA